MIASLVRKNRPDSAQIHICAGTCHICSGTQPAMRQLCSWSAKSVCDQWLFQGRAYRLSTQSGTEGILAPTNGKKRRERYRVRGV